MHDKLKSCAFWRRAVLHGILEKPVTLNILNMPVKGLYDEDILEEEVLIKWHEKKSKGDTLKIKEASTVFITWLKSAEEESEEEDDDDEEEEDSD
jgi:hypothetical protein